MYGRAGCGRMVYARRVQAQQPYIVRPLFPDRTVFTGEWQLELHGVPSGRGGLLTKKSKKTGEVPLKVSLPLAGPFNIRFTYRMVAKGYDSQGVAWAGETTETLGSGPDGATLPERELFVEMHRQPRDVSRLSPSDETVGLLIQDSLGRLVLKDIDELLTSLAGSLPSGSLSLAGKVLDGLIKTKGQRGGWWPAELDTKPLGVVLKHPEVVKRGKVALGAPTWERLEHSFLYLRNTGAHQKYVEISIATAESEAELVLQLLEKWVPL